jgi:hypothetical protein
MDDFIYEKYKKITTHELMHALGFSSNLYEFYRDANNNFEFHDTPIITTIIRSRETYILTTPYIAQAAKVHVNLFYFAK